MRQQCIGEHKAGAFVIGGSPQWVQCQNKADLLLDVSGARGEKGYICWNCYDDFRQTGRKHKILKVFTSPGKVVSKHLDAAVEKVEYALKMCQQDQLRLPQFGPGLQQACTILKEYSKSLSKSRWTKERTR